MLYGKKINLVALEEESLTTLKNWRNNPNLRKYFREHREINNYMQENWFKKIMSDPNQFNFEIRKEDVLIGHCGLYYINWIARHGEFGIYIGNEEYRNGGYGSDALRTLINYGFEQLNLNKIWCEVYSNNQSVDIYRHIGFKDEGILREHYYADGRYWDSYMLSILKKEFNT